ncbi:S-layer homology domain-containing protein [Desulfofalx alkaliphila]|uniref:S-layer homology domain-containing protein n=1 Tax=Desulfofalx alkaliphila TaxID=105483 RepID=UPI001A9A2DE9|nr:S-layer homology domain-containing protein [Desulfofalx alkaliphila]
MALISAMLLALSSTAWAAQPIFSDVTGDHWARPSVEEMNAAGVIAGHTDGTFGPRDPVTLNQTIVMLARINNLVDEAERYNLQNCSYEFPPGANDTVKKYLAVAADRGWLNAAGLKHMNPNSAASRQEVAIIVAAAFDLRGNADKLPFTDKNKISSAYHSYIAGVYEAGIMQGRTTTQFDPTSSVLRQEVATILSRLTEKGLADPNPGKRLVGYIEKVDTANSRVTINTGSGLTSVYTLSNNAPVYSNEKLVSISNIPSSQLVRAYLDNNNRITFIKTTGGSIKSPVNNNTSKVEDRWGYVKELALNTLRVELMDGSTKTYNISSSTGVYDANNKSTSLLSLNKDALVKMTLRGNDLQRIDMIESSTIEGHITSIRDDRITIGKDGRQHSYDVDSRWTSVTDHRDSKYYYDDLSTGYVVKITHGDGKAYKIQFLEKGTLHNIGTVSRLNNERNDDDDWRITIIDNYGNRNSFDVNYDVAVYDLNGKKISFWQLDSSDRDTVMLHLDKRGKVETIELVEEYNGIIEDLSRDEIKVGRKILDLPRGFDIDRYIIGSEVTVYVHKDEVKAIEVTDDEDITVTGTISSVSERDWEIEIRQDSGNRFTFDVYNRVTIRDRVDDDNLYFEDLKRNWEVELELKNKEVRKITVYDK